MIVVFGAQGMLGKAVCKAVRDVGLQFEGFTKQNGNILLPGLLEEIRDKKKPDIVINCAGDPNGIDLVNSLGPHFVAEVFKASKIFHVSTDCVYNHHATRLHSATSFAHPNTEYGISKLLGESRLPHVVNVRTSFIGNQHGLLHWFLSHEDGDEIEGYADAWWSGSTVDAVAEKLVEILYSKQLSNIEILATPKPINKYNLLNVLNVAYSRKIKIHKNDSIYINRSMEPTIPLMPIEKVLMTPTPLVTNPLVNAC